MISNKYKLSFTLTYIEENNRVYNWLNGEYIEFDDKAHPFLNIIKNKLYNFKQFKYKQLKEDL